MSFPLHCTGASDAAGLVFFLGGRKAGCGECEVSWALHACAFLRLSSGESLLSPWGQALPGLTALAGTQVGLLWPAKQQSQLSTR